MRSDLGSFGRETHDPASFDFQALPTLSLSSSLWCLEAQSLVLSLGHSGPLLLCVNLSLSGHTFHPRLHQLNPEPPLPPALTALPPWTAVTLAWPQEQPPHLLPAFLCYSKLLDAVADHTPGVHFVSNLVLDEILSTGLVLFLGRP